jgi:hypothetical protein
MPAVRSTSERSSSCPARPIKCQPNRSANIGRADHGGNVRCRSRPSGGCSGGRCRCRRSACLYQCDTSQNSCQRVSPEQRVLSQVVFEPTWQTGASSGVAPENQSTHENCVCSHSILLGRTLVSHRASRQCGRYRRRLLSRLSRSES